MQHNQQTPPAALGASAAKWRTWRQLRLRYQGEDRDLWTDRELAHLRFLHWLVQTGRLVEDGGPAAAGAGATGR